MTTELGQEDADGFESEIDAMLYELAFARAREFDRGGPPSSIFDDGVEDAATALLVFAKEVQDPHFNSVLRDIYDALMGRGGYRLTLSGSKRGRTLKGVDLLAKENAGITMLRLVDFLTEKMGKREAAVAAVAQVLGHSRATIFERMREGRAAIDRRKKLDDRREI